MLVLSLEKDFILSDRFKHFYFDFNLDKDYKKMEIAYSYYPKTLDDKALSEQLIKECYSRYELLATPSDIIKEMPLNNLITLSLDYENSIIGNAHRHHNNKVYTISSSNKSDGFINQEIKKGRWRIGLSTHAILSPTVTVNVEVSVYD